MYQWSLFSSILKLIINYTEEHGIMLTHSSNRNQLSGHLVIRLAKQLILWCGEIWLELQIVFIWSCSLLHVCMYACIFILFYWIEEDRIQLSFFIFIMSRKWWHLENIDLALYCNEEKAGALRGLHVNVNVEANFSANSSQSSTFV